MCALEVLLHVSVLLALIVTKSPKGETVKWSTSADGVLEGLRHLLVRLEGLAQTLGPRSTGPL